MRDEPPAVLAAWRAAYRASMEGGSAACPSEETLAALALGELGGEARTAAADHVVTCRRCADAHGILTALHREAGGRRRSPSWLGVASAAAVAAAAAGILLSRPGGMTGAGSRPQSELRGAAAQAVEPQPAAVLDAAPAELSWTPGGEASFLVRLYDADGDLLWEGQASGSRLRLPPEAAMRLAPGHAYFWTVIPAEGGRPARRGPYWFQIRGRP